MRTQSEVFEHMQQTQAKQEDIFGFYNDVLTPYLNLEQLQQLGYTLKSGAVWTAQPLTQEAVLKEVKDYMDFALQKMWHHRGISAARSIEHYRAWMWLLGDQEALDFLGKDEHYMPYGGPMLAYLMQRYSISEPTWLRDEERNMLSGKPCEPGCKSCVS